MLGLTLILAWKAPGFHYYRGVNVDTAPNRL